MKTVNVDLDGVVYPWHEVMAEWVWNSITGTEWNPYETKTGYVWEGFDEWPLPFPAPTGWNFEEEWDLLPKQFYNHFRQGVEAGYVWRAGTPIEGAVKGLWELDEAGYYIRLVTKRLVHKFNHATILKSTSEWLDRWNVPYHEIAVMGKHSSKGMFKADLAIDDNVKHIREYQKASIKAVLLDRPWNGGAGKLTRVKTWGEFVGLATRQTVSDREQIETSSSSS